MSHQQKNRRKNSAFHSNKNSGTQLLEKNSNFHQNNILVALEDRVTAGQHIGNLVSLGTNAHVHFDMLDAGGRDAVQCPLVYFSPAVAEAWESLYDEKIRERDERRIKEGRGPVPALPDVCNEVDLPSG